MTTSFDINTSAENAITEPTRLVRSPRQQLPDAQGLHRIVVVGGGAAGLELASCLGDQLGRRGLADIALVDCARTQVWKPLPHEVAAGSLDPAESELSYIAQAHWHAFRYRLSEMIGLDRTNKQVHLAVTFDDEGREITPPRAIGYDTLVIAVGSVTNDFGTRGVAQHAVPLETPAQAARFNRRLVNAFFRAQAQPGPVRPGQLHVAIVGAGATGTELAAELDRTAREVVAYGPDRIDPGRDIRITLIEAASRILPGLPERISSATHRLLEQRRIEVRTGAKVTEVTADGLRLGDGSYIASELVVWAAGVKAPAVLAQLDGLETNRINQLVVKSTLQTTRDPDIFAIGDCAACPRPGTSTPVPPRAQAAHPTSRAYAVSDRTPVVRGIAPCLLIPRLRLTGFPRTLEHRRESHGLSLRPWRFHRGIVRKRRVPLASSDARVHAARNRKRRIRSGRSRPVTGKRSTGEAALIARCATPHLRAWDHWRVSCTTLLGIADIGYSERAVPALSA